MTVFQAPVFWPRASIVREASGIDEWTKPGLLRLGRRLVRQGRHHLFQIDDLWHLRLRSASAAALGKGDARTGGQQKDDAHERD
jgi:hypothetical protein